VSETRPILILISVTVILAVYTLLGWGWWMTNSMKWLPWIKKSRFRVLLIFSFGWLAFIALFLIAPLWAFDYFGNDINWSKIGSNGRFFVFLGWMMPTLIYIVIYLIRKSKSDKK
jgi:hypothetical protein